MISVIIVNYNTRLMTFECIKSIFEQTKDIEFQIIVVDNASIDDSVIFLKEKFPTIEIIQSPINLGFGRANNLGVKMAKGEFIFLLNSDTKLIENSLKFFYDFFVKHENELNIGVVGGILIYENFKMNNCGGDFPKVKNYLSQFILFLILKTIPYKYFKLKYPKFFNKIKSLIIKDEFSRNKPKCNYFKVDQIIGANMFMKRHVFNQFGGFCEDFFMNYEETELQKRMSNDGYSQIIFQETKIIHYSGGSGLGKIKNFQRIVTHQSMHTYFKKHDFFNYYLFMISQIFYLFFNFLNFNYKFKENIHYVKAMLSFLIFRKIYGINSQKNSINFDGVFNHFVASEGIEPSS